MTKTLFFNWHVFKGAASQTIQPPLHFANSNRLLVCLRAEANL